MFQTLNQIAVFLGTTTVVFSIYNYFTGESEITKLRGEVGIVTGSLFVITALNNIKCLKD